VSKNRPFQRCGPDSNEIHPIQTKTHLDAMERMIAMSPYHTITATQQTPRKAIFALVFAIGVPAGGIEITAKEVAMAVMT
jgi:hypothetical protein